MKIKDAMLIDFAITGKCNYKCPYCDQGPFKQNNKSADDEICDKLIDFIINYPKTVILQLVGGEPTIHPRFMDIAKKTAESGNYLQTCTNFSNPVEFWEELVSILKDKLCRLQVSFHPTQIKNKDEFIDKIIKFEKIKHPNTEFIVSCVLTEDNYSDIIQLREALKDTKISFELQHERDPYGNYTKYNEKLKKLLEESPHVKGLDAISNKSSYGIKCSAGANFITISPQGEIRRCYGEANCLYHMGNIKSKFFIYKRSIPCMCKHCTCNLPFTHGCLNFNKKMYFLQIYSTYLLSLGARKP